MTSPRPCLKYSAAFLMVKAAEQNVQSQAKCKIIRDSQMQIDEPLNRRGNYNAKTGKWEKVPKLK